MSADGWFGGYGGQFVPETLVGPLEDLEQALPEALADEAFVRELNDLLRGFAGRPTALTQLRQLGTAEGVHIWLKREDLTHTGAHKVNNCVAQALLARRLGKRRIVAETGAGQHGVAVAAVCAHLGLECTIYMGVVDADRQAPNLSRMRLLGADIQLVSIGSGTLKDAINEAIRHWLADPTGTHYLLGSAVGPHPYPSMVKEFQKVIGTEARAQFQAATGGLPDVVLACVGGGSNSIGMFSAFIDDPVRLIGVQAAGDGTGRGGANAAPLIFGELGIVQGMRTSLLQDDNGQILLTHSIAPGLDYPAVGPEHCHLRDSGRVEYVPVTDAEALAAFQTLSRQEGIIPALESAHAVAAALRMAEGLPIGSQLLVNLSGRGDKDIAAVAHILDDRESSTGVRHEKVMAGVEAE